MRPQQAPQTREEAPLEEFGAKIGKLVKDNEDLLMKPYTGVEFTTEEQTQYNQIVADLVSMSKEMMGDFSPQILCNKLREKCGPFIAYVTNAVISQSGLEEAEQGELMEGVRGVIGQSRGSVKETQAS